MKIKSFFYIAFSILISFNSLAQNKERKFKIHTLAFYNLENLFDTINDVKNNSLDAYARARSAYYQQRDKLLQDNLPKGELKDDLDEFETFFTE